MKLFKHSGLMLSLALACPGIAHAGKSNDNDLAITIVGMGVISVVVAAATYLVGKGASILTLAAAHDEFDKDIQRLKDGNDAHLIESINNRSNKEINTLQIDNNLPAKFFPLIEYKNKLERYIIGLSFLQIFNIDNTQRCSEMQHMNAELEKLREKVTGNQDFSRQAFEQYKHQRKHRPFGSAR